MREVLRPPQLAGEGAKPAILLDVVVPDSPMSNPHAPPLPEDEVVPAFLGVPVPPAASDSHAPPPPMSLYKMRSWSPDTYRDEAWLRRKKKSNGTKKKQRSKSVTDEDVDELKACIELGFGFDSPEADHDERLSDTLPALGLYYAVNKHYNDSRSKPPTVTASTSSTASDCETPSPLGSPHTMFGPGNFI